MSAWKPIETAPGDRYVLVRNPKWNHVCYVAYTDGIEWFDASDDVALRGPTEWTGIPK